MERGLHRLYLVLGLILVIGVLGGFLVAYVFLRALSGYGVLIYILLTIAILGLAIPLLLYKAYKKRQFAAFSIVFSIIGVLLFSFSTIVTLPYYTTETIRKDWAINWFNTTLTINPLTTTSYKRSDTLWLNGTLIQIKISPSGKLNFKLYAEEFISYTSPKTTPVLNRTLGGFTQAGEYGVIYYWAPHGPQAYSPGYLSESRDYELWFILENPSNSEIHVYFQVDEFYLKGKADKTVTNYSPAIDSNFSYVGIGLIGVAATLESLHLLRQSRREKHHT